jgi:hypothetical protein
MSVRTAARRSTSGTSGRYFATSSRVMGGRRKTDPVDHANAAIDGRARGAAFSSYSAKVLWTTAG